MNILKTYRFQASLKAIEAHVKESVFEHKIEGSFIPISIVTKRGGSNRSESGYGGVLCVQIYSDMSDKLLGKIRLKNQGLVILLGLSWVTIALWAIASNIGSLIVVLARFGLFFCIELVRDYFFYSKVLLDLVNKFPLPRA